MDNGIKEEIIKLRCKLGDTSSSLFDAKIGRSAGLNRYLGYSASPDDILDTRQPIQKVIQDNDKEDTQ